MGFRKGRQKERDNVTWTISFSSSIPSSCTSIVKIKLLIYLYFKSGKASIAFHPFTSITWFRCLFPFHLHNLVCVPSSSSSTIASAICSNLSPFVGVFFPLHYLFRSVVVVGAVRGVRFCGSSFIFLAKSSIKASRMF